MTYFFHIGIGMIVIVLQTTVFHHIGMFIGFYDLLIVQIIYLGLYRPLRESLVIVGLVGFTMDSLTGGPYGLYLTTYFWIFASVRWSLAYFHLSDTFIIPFVVAFGVMLENLIHLAGTISFESTSISIARTDFRIVTFQLLWAVLTGPLVLILLNMLYQRSGKWFLRVLTAGKED